MGDAVDRRLEGSALADCSEEDLYHGIVDNRH